MSQLTAQSAGSTPAIFPTRARSLRAPPLSAPHCEYPVLSCKPTTTDFPADCHTSAAGSLHKTGLAATAPAHEPYPRPRPVFLRSLLPYLASVAAVSQPAQIPEGHLHLWRLATPGRGYPLPRANEATPPCGRLSNAR